MFRTLVERSGSDEGQRPRHPTDKKLAARHPQRWLP